MKKLTQSIFQFLKRLFMPNIFGDFFESLAKSSTEAISILDLNGKVLFVNSSFELLFGWNSDEIYGINMPIITRGELETVLEHIYSGQEIHQVEAARFTKKGQEINVLVSVSPIKNTRGQMIAISAICKDITEHKKMEYALLESDAKYRCLIEESLMGVFMYQDQMILYINPYLAAAFGYSQHSLIHNNPLHLFVDEDRSMMIEHMEERLIGKEGKPLYEVRGMNRDGNIICFQFNGSVTNYKNKPAFIGTLLDITQEKSALEMVKESEARYRRLIKLLPDPIFLHSNGIIHYMNDASKKLFNTDHKEKHILDLVHEESQELVKERIQRVMESDDKLDYSIIKLVRSDGTVIETESTDIYIYRKMGQPLILSVFRDITDRKKSEERIKSSEKLSVIGQLAAGVAHEIRNPLTSLIGFTQLIKTSHKELDKYTGIMLTELDRINFIVNEFMYIAKPHNVTYKQAKLEKLLNDVITLINTQAILEDVYIECDIHQNIPRINCNEGQLKQVFLNLLKNGIEAMPSGGTIQLNARLINKDNVLIEIIDQGIGIPEEKIEKLGEPFFTTKESGTGLGLMVSYKIIKAHGGNIEFTSRPNQGTTVKIYLPQTGI
jgi:two-component system sporulation sensor kinase A